MALVTPISITMAELFPHGAFGLLIEQMTDFDKSSRETKVQALDKTTGLPMWALTCLDGDPDVPAAAKTVKIKIPAGHQPTLPDPIPGTPLCAVELDGLSVTPYVNDRGRVAYSYRASGIRPAGSGTGQRPVKVEAA